MVRHIIDMHSPGVACSTYVDVHGDLSVQVTHVCLPGEHSLGGAQLVYLEARVRWPVEDGTSFGACPVILIYANRISPVHSDHSPVACALVA